MAVSGGHSDDADLDRDGSVTSLDALTILQAAGGGDMIAMWNCSCDENMTT